ncbi:hypothetical protein [Streptomyces sp. H27-C3]|uniref:hypothetical protein n=1 Tax=Streptomyces sp. H27-C3 TaxID=3046305 RepID=UPI0024BA10AE|nr:hypothetical protein [Streptomyces sp. H27-C3]MDJ0465020.1 hypothetical protein [Streptomyces sp. H27-C3]
MKPFHRSPTRALRRRSEAKLAALELPRTSDMRLLVSHVSDRIGHPIVLRPRPLDPRRASGTCVLRHGIYVITYQVSTSVWHQQHAVGHEAGHLIAGHRCVDIGDEDEDGFDEPPPRTRVLGPAAVSRMLCRSNSHFDEPGEREAEVIGTLLQQHLAAHASPQDQAATWVAPALEHTWGGRV